MKRWLDAWAVYLDRRVITILFLGFASGLPLPLVLSTFSAWLADAGVSLTAIGLASWVGVAYTVKFLWSPAVDRLPLPWFSRRLGQRRGWLLAAQFAAAVAMLGLGASDPATNLGVTIAWAAGLAFASATQDIVIDAYRIESLTEEQFGAGAANYVVGARLAALLAGAGALILADVAGWFWAYATMAGLMAVGIVTTLACPEPVHRRPAEALAREARGLAAIDRVASLAPRARTVVGQFYAAVVCPFVEFMTRPGWLVILLFIMLYKYGDALLGVMANPFYLAIGFTKTEIGLVSKGYGLAMSLIGGVIGGALVARLGMLRALLVGGILQAVSNLVYAAQAYVGPSVPMLMVTISVENLTGGMGTAAFVAYLSSLCNVAYTATQYALLSSFMAFARTLFAAGGGWLAEHLGWVPFFLVTVLAALPGLLLLAWMIHRYRPPAATTEVAARAD